MCRWLLLLLGAGCGRLSFDAGTDGGDVGDGGVDALAVCGARATPDPSTIRGKTFEYTSFMNDIAPIDGVTAAVFDASTGAPITQVVSDVSGDYALSVPTNGEAVRVELWFVRAGYFSTRVVPERPVDADVTGMSAPLWALGDAPLWDQAAMDAIYGAIGMSIDPAKSTVNIAVRDCAGAMIEGVEVSVDPAPERMSYQAANGRPSATLTSTVAPFAHVLLLNAIAGPTLITATKAGRTFLAQDVDVGVGSLNTALIVRAID